MYSRLASLPLLYLGGTYLAVALFRLRNPNWRQEGWWARHRLLGYLFVGLPVGRLPRRARHLESAEERAGALLQMIVGAILLGFGGLVLVVGIRG